MLRTYTHPLQLFDIGFGDWSEAPLPRGHWQWYLFCTSPGFSRVPLLIATSTKSTCELYGDVQVISTVSLDWASAAGAGPRRAGGRWAYENCSLVFARRTLTTCATCCRLSELASATIV